MTKIPLFILCLFFSLFFIQAEDSWRVVFEVSQEEQTPETRSILQRLFRRIERYEEHQLSEKELLVLQERDSRLALDGLYLQLDQWINQRDQLIYQEEQREEYKRLSLLIEEARKDIDEFQEKELEDYEDLRTIQWVSYSDEEPFYPLDLESDSGEWEYRIQAYILNAGDRSRIRLTGRFLQEEEELLWQGWLEPEDLDTQLDEMEDRCRDSLLGRPWASVAIEVNPEEGSVSKGDSLLGIGQLELFQEIPGPLTLTLRAAGYQDMDVDVELEAGRNPALSFEMVEIPQDMLWVRSEPEGADVYLGSQWKGITPLQIMVPEENLSLLLDLDGYQDLYFPIYEFDEEITYSLEPLERSMSELLEVKKRKFYNSLGIFTVSLIFPIIMSGIQENRAILYTNQQSQYHISGSQADRDLMNQYHQEYLNSYYTYGAALAVSGICLSYSIYRLVDYIRTSEKAILED